MNLQWKKRRLWLRHETWDMSIQTIFPYKLDDCPHIEWDSRRLSDTLHTQWIPKNKPTHDTLSMLHVAINTFDTVSIIEKLARVPNKYMHKLELHAFWNIFIWSSFYRNVSTLITDWTRIVHWKRKLNINHLNKCLLLFASRAESSFNRYLTTSSIYFHLPWITFFALKHFFSRWINMNSTGLFYNENTFFFRLSPYRNFSIYHYLRISIDIIATPR